MGIDMKILHCADLHLDSKMESNLDKEAAYIRRDELLDTFERMVSFAEAEGVRLILIAGDMFDKQRVRKIAIDRVREQIQSHPEIDFLYLRGNHDDSDNMEALQGECPLSNLKMFSNKEWTTYDYDEVVVTGIEISKENSNTFGTNLVLDQDRLNIVMLHGQESNYDLKDKTEVVNLSSLRGKYIDYLALGHIHSYKLERLDDRGVYCYSGCLEGRGFDECGKKGCVLLDIDDGKITSRFIPMACREIHEVEVKLTPDMEMLDLIDETKQTLSEISSEDLVKIVVKGERQMDMDVDIPRLLRSFDKDFFFIKGYDETSIAIDYASYAMDKSLKGEFVRLMAEQDMPVEQRNAVIALGIKAITGEELRL